MALPRQPGLVVLLLLLLWGSWGCWSSPVPLTPCPEACVCLDHTLINCSSSGLPLAPRHPSMDRTVDLDLSHNLLSSVALRRPNAELRALRLGNNQISYLSLCLDKRSSDGAGHRMRSPGAWRNQRSPRCVSWAPSLLLLSMERNRLAETPRGLGGSRALQVLQLSYNQISTLEAGDLEGLQQLKELHLHHNLISSLHPRAFIGLTNLTVIDLSFNLLTSLSPATFWSLRVGLEVRGGGNPWRCDCDMASLKRRMALDEDEDQRLWLDMVCDSPSSLAGRDLLQLHEEDLGCPGAQNRPGLHQDLIVDHGSTVLLPCSMQKGSTWWTPKGQVSAHESQAGLLISDITERDAGLYICLSQSHEDVVSVYHLKIREIGGGQARANSRLPRSLPVNTRGIGGAYMKSGQVRALTQDQHLGLAVGLSVFFTFLVAFILGVFARPCIDVLWQKVCGKKNTSSQPGSASSAGQRPYDNQAYSDEEDDPEIVSDRERRVTFSTQENQEQSSVFYNVTVANGHPQDLPHTRHHSGEARGRDRLGDRGMAANSEPTLSQECEHIPEDNELGERRSLSSSSDEEQGNSTRTKKKSSKASSSQPVDDSIHQKKTDLDFSSQPFADWSPHLNDTKLTDQDQSNDSGEAFDFPESIQSGSARSSSLSGSFNHSKIVFPPSFDLRQEVSESELQNAKMAPDHFDSSGSSSCESDNEVTEYTFNQGAADEDEGTERISKSIDAQNNIWPKLDFSNVTRIKQRLDITVETVSTGPAVTLKDTGLDYTTHVKRHSDIKASTDFTSSSSESEEETRGLAINLDKTKVANAYQPHLSLGTVNPHKDFEINAHENTWPELDLNNVTGIKRHLAIKVVPESTGPAVTLEDTDQDYRYHVNPLPVIKESTDFTSSSSESEDQPNSYLGTLSPIQGFEINAREDRWPEVNLSNVKRVKRRLDIKATTETTRPALTLKDTDQDYRWSQLDIGNVKQVKQPVDIKASTDSTSSSDSDEEPTYVRAKIEKASPLIAHLGTVGSNKESEMNVQNESWPLVDLSRVTGVKRRLDIKVATETTGPAVTLKDTDQDYRYHVNPLPEIRESTDFTSSSSDSEEETMGPVVNLDDTHVKTEVENAYQPHLHVATASSMKDLEINARDDRWPELDFSINRVKRRLDIKATTESTRPALTLKDTDQDYRWSQLDIGNVKQVKQPVDIKASTDSTSSSDSDEEPTYVRAKIEKASPLIAHLGTVGSNKESEMNVQNESWPLVDLSRVTGVKRRLDIKVATETTGPAVTLKDTDQDYRYHVNPLPEIRESTDFTSSSSDSEEETMGPVVNLDDTHVKTEVENAYQPHLHVATASSMKDLEINARDDRWPELDFSINRVKRRLDIKATTETTRPAVTLKDTDQDYRWSQLDIGNVTKVKQPVDIKVSTDSTSSSDSDEEKKREKTSPLIAHLGTVGQNKESEMNVQNESWPLVDLSRVTGVKRRLDIKVATETTGPAVTLKDPDQDYRYHVNPLPEIKESTDFTSSSSDSEQEITAVNPDDAYVKTKVENANQPNLYLGTLSPIKDFEINAREDTWPELNLCNVNRVKRRLDIKATTETTRPAVTPRDTAQDYRYNVKPRPDFTASTDLTSSSSDSEEETMGPVVNLEDTHVKTKAENAYQPHLHLGTVGPIKDSEINALEDRWPKLNLSNISGIKQRLDIKVATPLPDITSSICERGEDDCWPKMDLNNVTGIKRRLDIKVKPHPEITESTDFTSSSSESEEDFTVVNLDNAYVKTKVENAYQPKLHLGTVSPIKDFEINAQEDTWPELDLGNVNRVKRRLDIKATTETTDPAVTLKDTDQDYWYPVKPHREVSTDFTSSSSDSEEETMGPAMNVDYTYTKTKGENAYKPHLHLGTVNPIKDTDINAKNDRWPELDLSRLPHIKRRLDFKASTETPSSAVTLDDTDDDWWSHLDLDNITRLKRRLDIKVPTPLPETTSIGSRVPLQSRLSSSSNDSESEVKVQMVRKEREDPVTDGLVDNTTGPKSIPGPEVTPDLESRWAGLNLGISRLRQRLDISKDHKAAPLKESSETEIWSSSGERVGKSKEWAEKSSTVKDLDIDAQHKTWPLVDLGNVTGVKRRLDIKVATPSPYNASSSGESGAADSWPALDLDNVTGIKRRLDFKATLSSNTTDISIEDRWKTQRRDVHALLESPPPVQDCPPPDSSPSSESEDDSTRENKRTDFTEYRTHGPARFAPSLRGTSDTEVASSFKTGDMKGWSSVTVDTQERRGLGALRAMSSERKRWDTDHEELAAEWSSQQSSGEDLEPHTSIISVQEARAPGRLPRSLQRAGYHERLMDRQGQGEDTKVDSRPPPEYLELQNSILFDLSNPTTDV